MKKVLLSISFSFCILAIHAQVSVAYDTLWTAVFASEDIVAHNTVSNNSGQEKTFQWVRNEVTAPDAWETGICDKNFCYLEHVGTKQFVLAAQEAGATLDVHLYPNHVYEGYGVYEIAVSEVADPTNAISAIYIFDSALTGTKEIQLANLKAYPNPTTGLFTLSGTEGKIASISIHDLTGKQMQRFAVNDGDWYSIANLPAGTYMMNLFDNHQQALGQARLITKF
jgi:hypothetical protein